jgi:hypothetical protein
MIMLAVIMVPMVTMAAVSATLGLKDGLHLHKIGPESTEHILDHMVPPDPEDVTVNFRRQMPIPQMPGQARQLGGRFMSDFDNDLRGSPNPQPRSISELQPISIRHRNCLGEIEEDIFALIRRQTNAAAVARVKIESHCADGAFPGPMTGGTMNRSAMHRHLST